MGHSFTFTDCHHAVLNFLVANAKINFDKVTIMVVKQHNVIYYEYVWLTLLYSKLLLLHKSAIEAESYSEWLNDGPPKIITADNASKSNYKMNLESDTEKNLCKYQVHISNADF